MLKMSGKTMVKLSHDIDSEEIQPQFDIQMKEVLCVCVSNVCEDWSSFSRIHTVVCKYLHITVCFCCLKRETLKISKICFTILLTIS